MALPRQEARLAGRKRKREPKDRNQVAIVTRYSGPASLQLQAFGIEKARFRKEESVILCFFPHF
jgi:hypothetical protein